MADIFSELSSKFINSISPVVEKTTKSVVHIGVSDGSASQAFNLPDKSIVVDSDTLYVGSVIWTKVSDFLSSIASSKHYTLTYSSSANDITTSRPVVTFGNGVKGSIPTSGQQITMDYEAAKIKVSNRELVTLFASSINPVRTDFGFSITVNSIDYDTPELDIDYDADLPVQDALLWHARMLLEIKLIDADQAVYFKSQSLIVDNKQTAKSRIDSVTAITKWYRDMVNTYRKSQHVARFVLQTDVFEDDGT